MKTHDYFFLCGNIWLAASFTSVGSAAVFCAAFGVAHMAVGSWISLTPRKQEAE